MLLDLNVEITKYKGCIPMALTSNRINREKKTVEKMLRLYCKHHHGSKDELCEQCKELLDYAMIRLDKCKFGNNKPTCGNCTAHCYKPNMREKIIAVMRYSGPKMLFAHPVLAIAHLIDGYKK